MSNDTIKEIINDVRGLALNHLIHQPLTRFALDGIADRLQALCDAGTIGTTGTDETANAAEAPRKKPAGHVHTDGHILAWSYQDGHAVRVTCDLDAGTESIWKLSARLGNRLVVSGQVYGGKTVAKEVAVYLRNGLTRLTLRNLQKRRRRAAKKAAAQTPASPVLPAENKEGK